MAAAEVAPVPRPKSPPALPDPCGRHRLQLAVDALHREIGFLEGEINSIEWVQPASKCCQEVDEFIGTNPDPFITIPEKRGTESWHILKKFRARICFNLSWICCCCSGCSFQLKRPSCSCGQLKKLCCQCHIGCPGCCRIFCCKPCCRPQTISCPECSCGCICSCSKCSNVCACPRCTGTCCTPRCICP